MLTQVEVLAAGAPSLLLPIGVTTGSAPIQIKGIDGLTPVKASITTAPYGTIDAESLVGSSVGKRNIVFKLGLNPDWADQTIEGLRQELYKYFMPKDDVALRFTSTHLPLCEIFGTIEGFEQNIFSKDPEIQVSVICPSPDFVALDPTVIDGTVGDGSSGYTIDHTYSGMPAGVEIEVVSSPANDSYSGPLDIQVNSGIFSVDPVAIDALNTFNLGSIPGDKYVRRIAPAGLVINLLGVSGPARVWPVLRKGVNSIKLVAEENGQTWQLVYYARFGGL